MIPDWITIGLDLLTTLVLVACVILLARCTGCFSGLSQLLLLAICLLSLLIGEGSILPWANLMPQAASIENFLLPLIPTLWLFLFVAELERQDREQLERAMARTMAVHKLASELTVTKESAAIMEEVVDAAARLLDAPFAALLTLDRASGDLLIRASRGITAEETAGIRVPVGQGIGGRAFLDRHSYRLGGSGLTFVPAMAAAARRHNVGDAVSVPLLFRHEAVGLLNIGKGPGKTFTDSDITLLETLGAQAAVAIENARLYEQLAESEAKYRAFVENTTFCVVVIDSNRHITFWNRAAEALYGYRREEVLGRHIEFIYPEDKRADVAREILSVLDREGKWFGEYPQIRKDGSRFTGFLSLARVHDTAGQILCTLGVHLDASEQVQLRERLIQAQKMETIGALAGGVAHDFNNLLTAILGFAGLLKASLPPGTEDYDAVLNIEHAGQRGSQLVRQLLTFSQKNPTRAEPVDLNEVVGEVGDLVHRTFPPAVEVVCLLASDLRPIRGDSTQMHQVIMNLAVNARDAMPKGGTLTIKTENVDLAADDPRAAGLKPGPCVCLAVSDTGTGIPPEVQPHVFEPFYTTKPLGSGTGLGLSTTYGIVMRHSGRITFRSEMGGGTTFYVVLPAMGPKPAAAEAPNVSQPVRTP